MWPLAALSEVPREDRRGPLSAELGLGGGGAGLSIGAPVGFHESRQGSHRLLWVPLRDCSLSSAHALSSAKACAGFPRVPGSPTSGASTQASMAGLWLVAGGVFPN